MIKWYEQNESQNNNDIVLSTRIRLARNICGYPFEVKLSSEKKEEINEKVSSLFYNRKVLGKDFVMVKMKDVSQNTADSLISAHLISPEFLENNENSMLLMSKDEQINIMIHEEDHLRIQVLYDGLNLTDALDTAIKFDDFLSSQLEFAFSENFGYLTSCPTNLGTGLRASVMLHLPILNEIGEIQKLISSVNKLGFTMRGYFGESSEPIGSIFQVSNQITLGISESQACENLNNIVTQIISMERNASKELLQKNMILKDKIFRSYAILKHCKLISYKEAMNLLSMVRLAIANNMIKNLDINSLENVYQSISSANIINIDNEFRKADLRDKKRAEILNDFLENIKIE